MKGNEIRKNFVEYFEKRAHKWVYSSPVVPKDDPTLLFANAGMNQFKPIFLGKETREYTRAANYQKCIRVSGKHNDLEEVGKDTRHHTFFEMLGNWSFGDYYKKEAIEFAWDYLTNVMKLPKDKLYATVYLDDNEAEECWKKYTDIDHAHISRCGMKDNFWEMGDTGPCGPCSEIHYDRGEKYASMPPGAAVNEDGERYFEIWNLVFIQYNRLPDGSLEELSSKHVDTGMGLERLAAVLQEKDSNYETDLFMPIIDHIAELTGKKYDPGLEGMAFRVIADHLRALSFTISDGALPSNEGRGYVLRRLLRRAVRYGNTLGMDAPFIYKLVPALINTMGEAYPELKEQHEHIGLVIKSEEERFFHTLGQGITIFNKIVDRLKKDNAKTIPGKDAFALYDTYGFPLDLTQLMAEELEMNVNVEDFNMLMEKQRETSRKAGKFSLDEEKEWVMMTEGTDSEFKGYETGELETVIRRYIHEEDDKIELILAETPFYAESGGQIADSGTIEGHDFEITIHNVQKTLDGIVHFGKINGHINTPEIKAIVDSSRLKDISRNHSATHLLQAALRKLLGDHVHQSGSLVDSGHLRFDFTHFHALTKDEIREIEEEVNKNIASNIPVETQFMSLEKAKESGATALFGEKYENIVRVVSMGDVSKELCGGIHCGSTGEIGLFKITSESAVAAGVRRIEAKTGMTAFGFVKMMEETLKSLTPVFNTTMEKLPEKVFRLIDENKQLAKELETVKSRQSRGELDTLISKAEKIEGVDALVQKIQVEDVNRLREAADFFRDKLPDSAIVLASDINGKATFIASVSDGLAKGNGLHAGKIIKETAAVCGGGGGGKPTFAQAGGKDIEKIPQALEKAREIIKNQLS